MPTDLDNLLDRAAADVEAHRKEPKTEAPKTETASAAEPVKVKEPLPPADRYIKGFYIALCAISVVELYSASSREVSSANVFAPLIRHCLTLVLGIVVCFQVSKMKMTTIVRLTPVFVVVSVLMMLYVLLFGKTINGALRSIVIAGQQIQPTEFLKISAVLIVAYIMARNRSKGGEAKNRGVIYSVAVVTLFGGLLFSQGLTNALLLMCISLSMMIIGGIPWKKFGLVILFYGLIGAGGIIYKLNSGDSGDMSEGQTINRATEVWSGRMSRFFEDSVPKYKQKITQHNRQEMFSYMAQANGGLTGVMPGNSRESARLPLAFSDYIYSIVVEDWGFLGGMLLLIIYLSIGWRAGAIASRCDRAFPAMLVMGMAVLVIMQALFHMAITTGVFPVSGQPLPIISKGGTSMIINSLAFGIMLAVSRYVKGVQSAKKVASQSSALPDSLNTANPTKLK